MDDMTEEKRHDTVGNVMGRTVSVSMTDMRKDETKSEMLTVRSSVKQERGTAWLGVKSEEQD